MENLNQLLTASSPSTKIELVTKIQEQVLKWAPAMRVLEEVIDDILALGLDQNQDVKKAIIGFIEEVCKQKIRMLPKVIKTITILLREESAMVIKRVIQACGSIYKATLQWMCTSEDVTDEMNECWSQLNFIKLHILDIIDHENDGIRTNAIKFLEIVVLLQTHSDDDSMKRENDFSLDDVPLTLAHIKRRKLEEEAVNIFDLLLKFHAASHISSVNLIACTGTLCTIAKMRPKLMGQVVEALKLLHSNLPPTLTNSQVASVRKNLKMQFINLLKQAASFEWRSMITFILTDLGANQNEINRAMPKMSKSELQMRTKRAHENEETRKAKRAKLDLLELEKEAQKMAIMKEMEVDDYIEQERKCESINEKFIANAIKSIDVAAHLIMTSMVNLPERVPPEFLKNYQPVTITPLSVAQQIEIVAKTFATQLTELKLGPGAKELVDAKPSKMMEKEVGKGKDNEDYSRDETTRKLRETLERMKDQPKLKQRIKTLKLHEITKPLPREIKHQFLNEAVRGILRSERQAIIGGMGFKRRKIITVFASTFMPSVRDIIMEYITEDIVKRFDLAFMWLFEEYSIMQGYTRFSYVKSEHKHDYAYNRLLSELILHIFNRGNEFRERESLIKRLYLEAPLISDESVDILTRISEHDDMHECGLILLKDLLIRRPPKEEHLLMTLLKFAVHQKTSIREKAIENVMSVYTLHQILVENVEIFAVKLIKVLEKPSPTAEVLNLISMSNESTEAWTEDMIKACLSLYLTMLPYNEMLLQELVPVYVESSSSDVKRVILRSIEAPIKKLGTESREILKILETCAKGTETLVTRIIYILTETRKYF
jgi:symplekin